jgi:FeS assembly SUF system protein
MRIHPPSDPEHQPPAQLPPDAPIGDRILHAIKQVFDPEIPINIYDLGLIYKVDFSEETGRAAVLMTLTTPNCPEAQTLPGMVKNAVETVPEVKDADVQITWTPPWGKEMMSDAAKMQLGMI